MQQNYAARIIIYSIFRINLKLFERKILTFIHFNHVMKRRYVYRMEYFTESLRENGFFFIKEGV